MPLSDTKIRNAKPSLGLIKLADGQGLYLAVTPSGGKLWHMDYRFAGKRKTASFGKYPAVSLADARVSRDELKRTLARGEDPAGVKAAKRRELEQTHRSTFKDMAEDWVAHMREHKAASHVDKIEGRLRNYSLPHLGRRTPADITPVDCLEVARITQQRSLDQAHRVLRELGQIFRWGIANQRVKHNPVPDLRGALPPVSKDVHYPAAIEPAALATVLTRLDSVIATPQVEAAVKLLPYLAMRPGELRGLRWEYVDLDQQQIRYTSQKTKVQMIVPMADQVAAVFTALQPITGDDGLVFPGLRSRSKPISDAALGAAMKSVGIGAQEAVPHGFRASFRTIGAEVLKMRESLLEMQLGHRVRDANGRAYNRTKFLEERTEMMQTWADYIDELRGHRLDIFNLDVSAG